MIQWDNVGSEFDGLPCRNVPERASFAERLRVFLAIVICAPLTAYLLIANVILRLP